MLIPNFLKHIFISCNHANPALKRKIFLITLSSSLFLPPTTFSQPTDTIIDSHFTWAELKNTFEQQYIEPNKQPLTRSNKNLVKQLLDNDLTLLNITYWGYDNNIHKGQIITNTSVSKDVEHIFADLLQIRFPIYQARPISMFGFNDKKSMEANNTTCFDFRLKTHVKQLSKHSFGLAIDINPVQNPYKGKTETLPANYNQLPTGRIIPNEETGRRVLGIFRKYGWAWGGKWRRVKDFMHFEKLNR